MNESEIIKFILSGEKKVPGVLTGIGDDAAVLKQAGKNLNLVVAADAVVENTHFRKTQGTPDSWGRKAVCVNVSDIAAMGAAPRYALVCIGLPGRHQNVMVRKLLRGIQKACSDYGITIVGGDTFESRLIIISVTMIGNVRNGRAVLRSGGRPGDVIFVTGPLGGSYKSERHLKFNPRVRESAYLTENYDIHAMIDVSDGLMKDLTEIAVQSRCGADVKLDAVPVNDGSTIENAVYDGEDFELLFALSQKDALKLLGRKQSRGCVGMNFYPIGMLTADPEQVNWIEGEKKRRFAKQKNHHFKRS